MENLKRKIHEIIFEADTPAGKAFDVGLIIFIIFSVIVVILESIPSINASFGKELWIIEWVVTILFTIEYLLRIFSVKKPWKYITSFYGLVDLFSILPTFLELLLEGSHFLLTIRILRLLRVFRLFKLAKYMGATELLVNALRASKDKIYVFLTFILLLVVIIGSLMYIIEGSINEDFNSIPESMYWAIVTLTTVGYGDITPVTPLGQFFSAFIMILGYAIIAVPTGIVTAEISSQSKVMRYTNNKACRHCGEPKHENDAVYCRKCGSHLDD